MEDQGGHKRKSINIVDHALSRRATTRSQRAEYQIPPVPPVPDQSLEMAWQRRSMKRESYTSTTFHIQPAEDVSSTQHLHAEPRYTPFRPQSTYFPVLQRLRSREQRQQSNNASWDDHTANPQQWGALLRWSHVATTLVSTFTITLASSINAPATAAYAQLGYSGTISVLPHSLFLLGLSFAAPMSHVRSLVGRKAIMLISLAAFAMFILLAALVRNMAAIATTRLFAAIVASSYIPTAAAVLLDLFPAGRRTAVFVLFASVIFLGTVIGPLFSSIVSETRSLPWNEYIVLFCAAPSLVIVLIMRETSHAVIASKSGVPRRNCSRDSLQSCASRLLRLVTQRSVWAPTSSIALVAAITFSLLQCLPKILEDNYAFDTTKQGCLLLALLCGWIISILSITAYHVHIYMPRQTQWEDNFVAEWDKFENQKHKSHIQRRTKSTQEPRKSRILTMERRSDVGDSPEPVRLTRGHSPGFSISPGLAVAIASEIDARPSTAGSYVSAEQIWAIAIQKSTFADVLDELELQFCVKLNRIKMIQLYESWSSDGARTSMILTTPLQIPQTLASPTTLVSEDVNHRAIALAVLESGDVASISGSVSTKGTRRSLYTTAPLLARQRPPPTWRMLPAFPGALLSTIGLFVLAWTLTTHWWVSAIGLAVYGCGAFTVAVCVCLYLVDTFGSEDIVHSLAIMCSISYMAAFASSMISVPMFANLSASWAITVLAFISLFIWVGPLCLQYTPLDESYYANDG